MKTLLSALNIVKNHKKCTKNQIVSREVERLNAGNSTSAWGLVFYR